MTAHSRLVAAFVVAGAAMTVAVVAETAGTQQAQTQTQTQPPPAGQRAGGAGAGAGGAGGAGAAQGRAGGGGRRGGFTQFTRELAPQDVLVRGKGLYEANCASCHASDLRGGPNGANLLRSGIALADQ